MKHCFISTSHKSAEDMVQQLKDYKTIWHKNETTLLDAKISEIKLRLNNFGAGTFCYNSIFDIVQNKILLLFTGYGAGRQLPTYILIFDFINQREYTNHEQQISTQSLRQS